MKRVQLQIAPEQCVAKVEAQTQTKQIAEVCGTEV